MRRSGPGRPDPSKRDAESKNGTHRTKGDDVPIQSGGLRVGVVGVGYWGSRHVRVLRSTTGVAAVTGGDQRFTRIDDGCQQIDHGVAAYADIDDALPHGHALIIATPPPTH